MRTVFLWWWMIRVSEGGHESCVLVIVFRGGVESTIQVFNCFLFVSIMRASVNLDRERLVDFVDTNIVMICFII